MSEPERTHAIANSAHRVDEHVFIGGYLAAADPAYIRANSIKRIVKMFADDASYPGGYHRHPGVQYFVAPAEDVAGYDIRPAAARAVQFMREGVKNGERILVHCHMGISRSSTVVLLYLMINHGLTLGDAISALQRIRPVVQPNPGFMRHLLATDARLRRIRAKNNGMARSGSTAGPKAPPSAGDGSRTSSLALFLSRGDERDREAARARAAAKAAAKVKPPPEDLPKNAPKPDHSAWSFKE